MTQSLARSSRESQHRPSQGGSVIKGGGVLIVARIVGMVCSFVLFLLLSWRSRETAGVFRTAVTFLVIMESLPLLGMHRWLSVEIAQQSERAFAIFVVAGAFAVGVGALSGVIYFGIADGGLYGAETSACLELVALATIPSALSLTVTSALVGIGYSHQSGLLALAETVIRSSIAVVLVLSGASVIWVMVVFLITRWLIACAGLMMIRSHLAVTRGRVDASLIKSFLSQVPNLAASMIAFLMLRNAAMLLLPWLRTESEAGVYAAPFRIFDLMLVIPTVLTISTSHAFVESAKKSISSLRRNTTELISITTLYIFPVATIASVLARPVIELLFGVAYSGAVTPLRLLIICATILSLDQVFSLPMVTMGHYRFDRICVVGGAISVLLLTILLARPFGATGAALGLCAGAVCTLGLRLVLSRDFIKFRLLGQALWLQACAAVVAGVVVWGGVKVVGPSGPFTEMSEICLAPVGALAYMIILHYGGGLGKRRLRRIMNFMAQRG